MITNLGGCVAGDDCLPVHDGEAALVLVHAQQREHGEVVMVQHHRVLNLPVVLIIIFKIFLPMTKLIKLTWPSSDEKCLQPSLYLFRSTLARPRYQAGGWASRGPSRGSTVSRVSW